MKFLASSSLAKLRDATRVVHKSLETLTNSDELLYTRPDIEHYKKFLGAQYHLHKSVELRATRLIQYNPRAKLLDWPECNRIAALEADLQGLAFRTNGHHDCKVSADSHAWLLGLVYVCEGSCIGNQRLYSALNKHENFRNWHCSEFLMSCKTGFSLRWKCVLAAIESISDTGSTVDGSGYDDIEQGALEGFDIFQSGWNSITRL